MDNQANSAATRSQSNLWTTPFHGVQHLEQQPTSRGRWATVTNWNSFAELDGWYPGCAFSPHKAIFDTIEEARTAGEAWVAHGAFPAQEAA